MSVVEIHCICRVDGKAYASPSALLHLSEHGRYLFAEWNHPVELADPEVVVKKKFKFVILDTKTSMHMGTSIVDGKKLAVDPEGHVYAGASDCLLRGHVAEAQISPDESWVEKDGEIIGKFIATMSIT